MDTVMTLAEVAEYLRVHPTTVYRLLKTNRLSAFKVGAGWRFSRESINRWVEEGERDRNRGIYVSH